MSQTLTFPQTVNNLFFGVNVSNASSSLLDTFLSVRQIHHSDTVARQSSLNVSMEMNSAKAWSSKHKFSFSESPLPELKISKGLIELTIGEAGEIKKLLNLNWHLEFDNKADATKYFDKLKQIFGDVSTIKKFEFDKDVGHMAQFSTRKETDKGIRDITLFLNQSPNSKKYEIELLVGNEFITE